MSGSFLMKKSIFKGAATVALLHLFSLSGMAIAQDQRYPITPCRILDTRDADAVANGFGTLSGGGEERSIRVLNILPDDIRNQGGLPGGCGIPPGTTAVDLNVTAVNPLGFGYLRVYPYVQGGPQVEPNATVLVWYAGISVANALTVSVCVDDGSHCDRDLILKNYRAGTDLAIEVLGYYLPAAASQ
jgi:hypothetical protein